MKVLVLNQCPDLFWFLVNDLRNLRRSVYSTCIQHSVHHCVSDCWFRLVSTQHRNPMNGMFHSGVKGQVYLQATCFKHVTVQLVLGTTRTSTRADLVSISMMCSAEISKSVKLFECFNTCVDLDLTLEVPFFWTVTESFITSPFHYTTATAL